MLPFMLIMALSGALITSFCPAGTVKASIVILKCPSMVSALKVLAGGIETDCATLLCGSNARERIDGTTLTSLDAARSRKGVPKHRGDE